MNPRLIVAGLVVAACLATGAQAQVTVDVAKITCEQFAFSKIAPVRSIALWLSGYYNGKRGNTVLDTQRLITDAAKLSDFCLTRPQMPIMQAVDELMARSK